MWGSLGVGSFAFVCAGWVMCRAFPPFPAPSRPLLGFRRPSCLLTLFCWRRPWAVLFFIPSWRWRVAPSVRFFLHTFLLLRGVSDCMYSALLTAVCLCEYSMGIPFAPYAGVRGWACSLSYNSSVTSIGAVIVVRFPLVWRGVACNILVLVS